MTMAITPSKSRGLDFGEVRRVCQDYTLAGLQAMFEARGEGGSGVTPFRFMYMSGTAAERDQNKTPSFMPPYSLMRVVHPGVAKTSPKLTMRRPIRARLKTACLRSQRSTMTRWRRACRSPGSSPRRDRF